MATVNICTGISSTVSSANSGALPILSAVLAGTDNFNATNQWQLVDSSLTTPGTADNRMRLVTRIVARGGPILIKAVAEGITTHVAIEAAPGGPMRIPNEVIDYRGHNPERPRLAIMDAPV